MTTITKTAPEEARQPDRPPDPRGHRAARHRARRDPPGHPRRPRRARRGVHPHASSPCSAGSSSARAPCCSARAAAAVGARHGRPLVAKILENMEIGHNVLHGQWDWMRDPKIHSTTWEWDMATPAEQWKHSTTRCTTTTRTSSARTTTSATASCASTRTSAGTRCTSPSRSGTSSTPASSSTASRPTTSSSAATCASPRTSAAGVQGQHQQGARRKIRKQATKDYVVNPALALPFGAFLPTLAANFTANVVRNLWSHSVIMCGHFPEGVETFERKSIPDNETRGEWYLRQMLGSANISGSKAMHLMSGNLSHQIEHHLFPDLPSNRYAEVAPKVQALFEKYDLNYCSRADAAAGLLGLAQGGPALAAQRLAGDDQRRRTCPRSSSCCGRCRPRAPRSAVPPRPGCSSRRGRPPRPDITCLAGHKIHRVPANLEPPARNFVGKRRVSPGTR